MSDSNDNQTLEGTSTASAGSVALNPNWTIGEVLSEAWKLKDGFKGTYWGAILIFAIISTIVPGVFVAIGGDGSAVRAVSQLVAILVTYPLLVGTIMIAIKHSVGLPTGVSMVFDYYPRTIPIFLLYLLMVVMVFLGFLLLILPGIYLSFAYMLALPLLVDKNMGLWEALEASRKAITPCWFRTFAIILIGSIITAVSAIPLGIGLIWTVPFFGLVVAIIYRNVVGVSGFVK